MFEDIREAVTHHRPIVCSPSIYLIARRIVRELEQKRDLELLTAGHQVVPAPLDVELDSRITDRGLRVFQNYVEFREFLDRGGEDE